MADLLKWRDEFPILQQTTYLISNSLGAMPRAVYDKMHEYAQTWDERGVRAWDEVWWNLAEKVSGRLGALLGAEPGTISLHQNVTLAQAVIASCFDFRYSRNKVVMVDQEFPSILYFYEEQCRRGARVEIIKAKDGVHVPLETLLAAINEETLLVPISHVLFRSAFLLDARAIIERAHKVGAHVVLDVYQAAGIIPINLSELGVDFAVGGVLKWLCGGPGVGYLYIRPDLRAQLAPTITGWMAHKRPFNFEPGPIDRSDGPYRFMNGTPQVPALYACQPGMDIVTQIGVERIRDKSVRQTERLIEGALERGWRVNTPRNAAMRGGTVSVECPHAQEVMRELVSRDILVDYRPKAGIRLSPHFYNRDEDIDLVLEQIGEILSTRSWARHFQSA